MTQFSPEIFKAPDAQYYPTYAWAWNARITKEEIDRQLEEFERAGIRSFYVIAFPKEFRPQFMKTDLDPPYLSEEFFSLVSYALHKAAERDMVLWIYDEGGWPSGGACGHTLKENPAAATDVLTVRSVTLKKNTVYYASEGTLASFIGKTRICDGFEGAADAEIKEYYTVKAVDNGNQIDYTNRAVTETFIGNTYEPYKAALGDLFGKRLPIVFTDEPFQKRFSMPKGLLERFKEEYGYDLYDRLYAILDDNCEDEADVRARIDYARLVGQRMKECFFIPLSAWCKKNGVAFGGHLNVEHTPNGGARCGYFSLLDCLRHLTVPGIDVIWDQIVYPRDDTVPMAEGSTFFPRIAPSAARQSGGRLSLSETFSVYGESFIPDEVRYVIGYQAVRGINTFNFMSIPFGKDRMQALQMRPGFRPEKPGFYHLRALNDQTARLSYLLRLGESVIDTALYHPSADFAASETASVKATAFYNALGESLEADHVGFDIIDDNGILSAIDEGDGLRLGNAKYAYISIPKCEYMPIDVYNIAKKYEGSGKRLLPVHDPKIRVQVRKIGEDQLWFFFNEGSAYARESIEIPTGMRAYKLELSLGEIQASEGDTVTVCPAVGETEVFLITKADLPTARTVGEKVFSTEDLKPLYMERFEIYEGGIRKVREAVPMQPDHFLSAEITYEVHYSLPEAPRKGESYRFTLENTRDTASICDTEGTLCVFFGTPMTATVDGGRLKKEGVLFVTVANTASGEIARKRQMLEDLYPYEEHGLYARRKMYALEARFDPPRIGSLTVERL